MNAEAMRLLNTTSIEVERFTGSVPQYAILSHRWEDDEVTLEDINAIGNGRGMKGYRKLLLACAMAARQNLKYIWIDTCCIDKKSSAELSEAINSMFRYYKEAEVCYTYLSDVTSTKFMNSISGSNIESDFYQSAWFKRGWTLQELIAPQNLRFYNKEWDFLGTKTELKDVISSITKIPEEILLGGDLTNEPVCRKMSWVASRQTTVPEDIAYCLLGIFQVHIPLLYGEGTESAFLRLQEAIIKVSDDDSIFLWRATEEEAVKEPFWGLLAKSPTYFSRSPDIKTPCTMKIGTNTPTTLTGRGLNVEFLMTLIRLDVSDSIFSSIIWVDNGKGSYGVLLQKLSYSGTHFARVGADTWLEIQRNMEVDFSKLPIRISKMWRPDKICLNIKIILRQQLLPEPKALCFYVRQNPKISQILPNEAVGFSLYERESLPPNMTVDHYSINWTGYRLNYANLFRWECFLEFETHHIFQQPTFRHGTAWEFELFGAVQLSKQLDGSLKRLILLLGLEHTSLNALRTPLVCQRPMYYLYDISNLEPDLDKFLNNFPPMNRVITRSELYTVSFDLQLRNGRPYYFVKVESLQG